MDMLKLNRFNVEVKNGTVKFYDHRYTNDTDWINGQPVSAYYSDTLMEHDDGVGLDLDGGVDGWEIDGAEMDQVKAYIKGHPLRSFQRQSRSQVRRPNLKKLYKSTDSASFVFEDEQSGQLISNPLWNPEMTSHADPKRYGFEVWDTGGGCTAHAQEFDLDGKKVIMLLTDQDSACIKPNTAVGVAGLYDEDGNEFDNPVYWEVTR